MLNKLLIAVSGRDDDKGNLTKDGLDDIRWLVKQVIEQGYSPRIIFCPPQPEAVASAYMIAGGLQSIEKVVVSESLQFGFQHHWKVREKRSMEFRDKLRNQAVATRFFSQMYQLAPDVEQVLFISADCWGGLFGKGAGGWPRGAIYSFDIRNQEAVRVGHASFGI